MSGPMLEGLPRLSQDEAYLRQSLAEALNGCRVGEAVMRACLGIAVPADVTWFHCADGLAFALLRLDGSEVRADPDDGPGAALLLERAEPCLAALEMALSIALEPHELDRLDDSLPRLIVRLEVGEEVILLAVPHGLSVLPAPAPAAPALTNSLPVPVHIRIAGPRLSPNDAATLGAGDLLLIGRGPLEARVEVGDAPVISGYLDPVARSFTPTHS